MERQKDLLLKHKGKKSPPKKKEKEPTSGTEIIQAMKKNILTKVSGIYKALSVLNTNISESPPSFKIYSCLDKNRINLTLIKLAQIDDEIIP